MTGLELPSTTVFDYPTAEAMAEMIVTQLPAAPAPRTVAAGTAAPSTAANLAISVRQPLSAPLAVGELLVQCLQHAAHIDNFLNHPVKSLRACNQRATTSSTL